ncbi:hypothetical protein SprV_0100136600 [Sparganum proliferum]
MLESRHLQADSGSQTKNKRSKQSDKQQPTSPSPQPPTDRGHLLNSWRIQDSTIRNLLFTDYCTPNTETEEGMQWSMELFTFDCAKLGLVISTDRTVIRHQSPPNALYSLLRICINGTHLKTVDNFVYLSSTLSRCIKINDELAHRIYKGSQVFSQLQSAV